MLGQARHRVLRRHRGGYVAGEYRDGGLTTFGVDGSVQPLTAREIELLPEGIRQRAQFKLYVAEGQPRMKVAGNDGADLGDLLAVDGTWFEVHGMTAYDAVRTPGFTLQHRRFALVGPNLPGGQRTPGAGLLAADAFEEAWS